MTKKPNSNRKGRLPSGKKPTDKNKKPRRDSTNPNTTRHPRKGQNPQDPPSVGGAW